MERTRLIIGGLCALVLVLAFSLLMVLNRKAPEHAATGTVATVATAASPGSPHGQLAWTPAPAAPLLPLESVAGLKRDLPEISENRQAAATSPMMSREHKALRLAELRRKFEAISASGKEPDIGEVDALLEELIAIQGTAVIGGVDLRVLQRNLKIAGEMQKLAVEMEAEQKKSNPDLKKIQAMTEKLQVLQTRLQASFGIADAPSSVAPVKREGS
jgi:hypothetical protein